MGLKEDLRENQSPNIQPKSITPPPKNIKEEIMGSKPMRKKPFKKVQYTSNSTLNSLLNETAMGDTSLGQSNSPVSMEGDFNTIGDMPTEAAPKVVQEAVTRDYSALMKAIDEKRKNR